ncbi:MAG: TetR/AcrR family transcriptional regulator [Microbacterium sp.]|uniref:TetR/AcrR family transcriptional regulator n=1 Tax=Microbacterium sp. TaxID=51671 RepID=UPI0009287874|nr:TetR/AcrR family transcriptional regulator [Microbacterium sp.]MBN9185616.1 TetR/AcrR family transcriptional regulator [Microbacterium sp.]MBN9188324.1 TetR/AcrR family transcriptional regulator [Microbacterium sp.]MBN9194311.1 TetR/AcrR family transcriptional regulator [Microbacterium sp.]OJU72492.1 MAG: TetR family transcriptional regulator [Microbacterium sp. 70-38]
MSAERRTRLGRDERRTQLVALGVLFLVDRPLEELSIDELARRAGVSRALVFHYFGSRQGMHAEVVATARDSLLFATEPRPELAPEERLRDTLARIVQFVREHRGTFYSLVRGVASGDQTVRAVIDESRERNAQRLIEVFVELGAPDTALLRVALRSWVAFAEEVLVELALGTEMPDADIVAFLEASVGAVVGAVDAR